MTTPMNIAGRLVGSDAPPYIVAELSGNHNGDPDRALEIIRRVAKSGADAVKIQTYKAETTIDHDGPEFTVNKEVMDGRSLYELYDEAHTRGNGTRRCSNARRTPGCHLFSAVRLALLIFKPWCPAYKSHRWIVDLPLIAKPPRPENIVISPGWPVSKSARQSRRLVPLGRPSAVRTASAGINPGIRLPSRNHPESGRRTGRAGWLSEHAHSGTSCGGRLGATLLKNMSQFAGQTADPTPHFR